MSVRGGSPGPGCRGRRVSGGCQRRKGRRLPLHFLGKFKEITKQAEHLKAKVHARVKHPFHIVKDLFCYRRVHYKGLAKNTPQMRTLFALANLVIAKRALLA